MWPFSRKGPSGFSSSSTAEQVTQGLDGTGLTAIVTGPSLLSYFGDGLNKLKNVSFLVQLASVVKAARTKVLNWGHSCSFVAILDIVGNCGQCGHKCGHVETLTLQPKSWSWTVIIDDQYLLVMNFNGIFSPSIQEDGLDITANSLHPGTIATNLFRHTSAINGLINVIGRLVLKNVQQICFNWMTISTK
ncbi:Short-chain dehydrogenase TIC 32 [Spatholobus suberectus]|nr:Short-chain dehydrogenase TIC 32 [Spatholobus suberectus]